MEHFKDNSGCSGPKKSEIFWNNSRKVQYVFAGVRLPSGALRSLMDQLPVVFTMLHGIGYLYLIFV